MTAPPELSGTRPVAGSELHWYRDPAGCLHSTLAAILIHAGHAPLPVLGASWEFRHLPDDVRPEEFYLPCRFPGDPARSIAPDSGLRSRWRHGDPGDGLGELADRLPGRLPIVAVDNFHLPFRPAWHDVHAAHLIVVTAVEPGSVHVVDAVPPAFAGWIPAAEFQRAWSSTNPGSDQDGFFAAAPIGRRWLDVDLPAGPPAAPDPDGLAGALDRELRHYHGGDDPPGWTGRAGLERWLDRLLDDAAANRAGALREAYPFGWPMQAQAALHGEYLQDRARARRCPALAEAARAVQGVAHAWTGVRVTAAHGVHAPRAAHPDLVRHAWRLRQAYDAAMDAIGAAAGELAGATR